MKLVIILISYYVALVICSAPDQGRIINGQEASLGQFPWMAYLTLYKTAGGVGSISCGGVLVAPRWVLSAAHCVDEAVAANVTLGVLYLNETDVGIIVNAESAVIHENYSAAHLLNDIALIKLDQEVEFTDNINIIDLGDEYIEAGVDVTVSGFGNVGDYDFNTTNILLYAQLKTLSNNDCADVYDDLIVDEMLCCTGEHIESTCYGDSGGPLITGAGSTAKLVGLVSFGSDQGCMKGYPTGYTRVSVYRDWILSVIQNS